MPNQNVFKSSVVEQAVKCKIVNLTIERVIIDLISFSLTIQYYILMNEDKYTRDQVAFIA